MEAVDTEICPFCKEALNTEQDVCPECGHAFQKTKIKKLSQIDYTREYSMTFGYGLFAMIPIFIALFVISMGSWANLDRLHMMVGFTFLIFSSLIGAGVGYFNKNYETTVNKAIIIAFLYAIAVSITISVYITMEAVDAWEYALPITGLVGSTAYIVLVAWVVQKIKHRKMSSYNN